MSSATYIGNYAFQACTSLSEVNIPNSVTFIGIAPFYNCPNLKSITVGSNNAHYSSDDGVLFDKTKTTLISYPAGRSGDYIVPSSVLVIKEFAFFVSKIASIDMNNVLSIGASAFQGSAGLASVTMDNVISIGNNAFNGCVGLASVTISETVTSIGVNAFINCQGLQSITVDPDNQFYSSDDGVLFDKTKTILISYPGSKGGDYIVPATVILIENHAFYNSNIASVNTNNAKLIGNVAFQNCYHLISVNMSGVIYLGNSAFSNCGTISSITIPDGVKYVGVSALYNCGGLQSVTISDSVVFIGTTAFYNCGYLSSITVDSNNPNFSSENNVLFDKTKTRLLCYPAGNGGDYVVPSSVRIIDSYSFIGSKVRSVTMGNVTSIGLEVFRTCIYCSSITVDPNNQYYSSHNGVLYDKPQERLMGYPAGKGGSYTVPSTTLTADINAFFASRASSLNLSNMVSLGVGTFNGCINLASIELPDTLISIGTTPFHNCTNLQSITVGPGNPLHSSEDGVLFDKSKTRLIAYPGGKGGDYVIPSTVSVVDANAFGTSPRITSVDLNNVVFVNNSAFINCANLMYVDMGNTRYIGISAFAGCGNLLSVNLSDNVAYIGSTVLYNSIRLESITVGSNNPNYSSENGVLFNKSKSVLMAYPAGKAGPYVVPSSVLAIELYAFYQATRLTSVDLGNVRSIGTHGFFNSISITSLTIPDGLTYIGHRALYNMTSLTSITVGLGNPSFSSEDGVLFNKSKTLLIQYPAEKGGEYTVPSSVTSIAYEGFRSSKVTSVNLNNVKSIGNGAFFASEFLTHVNLSNVTSIGLNAFNTCVALRSVELPSSLVDIGFHAFATCSNLESITVASDNQNFSSQDGVLFNKSKTKLICYPGGKGGDYIVPSTVSEIATYAFLNSKITSVDLSNTEFISNDAFRNCVNLLSVTIPDSVKSIGFQTFYDCTSLRSITVGPGNPYYSSEDGVLFDKSKNLLIVYPSGKGGDYVVPSTVSIIEMQAFRKSKITSVDISNVTYIGNHAFFGCIDLKSIDLRNVVGINNNALDQCHSLESVTVPDSVRSIGQNVFINCLNLESIIVGPDNENYSSEDGVLFDKSKRTLICFPGGKGGDYIVPSTVSMIDQNSFYVAKVESVDMSNATYIGPNAFQNCLKIKTVRMDNMRSIATNAFNNCPSLESVSIPDSTLSIGQNPFVNCPGLQSITVDPNNPNYSSEDGVLFDKAKTILIQYPAGKGGDYTVPSSVLTISARAFYAAHRVTSVSMSNVVTVESYAFYACSSLASVTLSENLKTIGSDAFRLCISLPSIQIPDGVEYIGQYTFYDCNSLQSVNVGPGNQNFSSNDGVLFDKQQTKLIYYPKEKGGNYIVPSTVLEIERHAFDGSKVTYVMMENVRSIGLRAFYCCNDLTMVVIPDSVVSIGTEAFRECSSLESIVVGSNNLNYSSDGDVLFDKSKTTLIRYPGKKAGTTYTIPLTVTTITEYAFQHASNLTTINVPGSVNQIIGVNVFQHTTALQSINVVAANPNMMSVDGILFDKSETVLIAYPADKAGTSYDIPSSVVVIRESAFFDSSNLVTVNVHDDVFIGVHAFKGGKSLENINVEEGNLSGISKDGVLFDSRSKVLMTYPSGRTGTYAVPEDVTDIQIHAFRSSNLTSLVISGGITTFINTDAFSECPELSIYLEGETIPRFDVNRNFGYVKGYYSHGIKDSSWWETPNFRPASEKMGAFSYMTLTPAPEETVFTGLEKTPVPFSVNGRDAPITRDWIESNIPEIGGMDIEFSVNGGETWVSLEDHILSQDTVGIARAFPPNDITVETNGHGTAGADKDAVVDGEDVTITITPDSKYKVSRLIVNNITIPLDALTKDGNSWIYVIENVSEDIHVVVNFAIDDSLFYDVTVVAAANGTVIASNIRPSGGSNVVVTITPKDGYKVKTFRDNGRLIPVDEVVYNEAGKYWTYTISEIIDNHIIATEFEIDRTKTYAVEIHAGPNGNASVTNSSPTGGSPVMVTITPSPGYMITSFKDGTVDIMDELRSAEEGVWTYSISEVISNHSFEVTFGIDPTKTYTVTATSGPNGTVSADPETASGGTDVTVTITPSPGYRIKSIRDNSAPVVPTVSSGSWTYVIKNIISDHTIYVEFEVDPTLRHRITVTHEQNGTASITDPDVTGGTDALVMIYPDSGYQVATIKDNGADVDVSTLQRMDDAWVYRISGVTSAHLVEVTFEIDSDARYRITMNNDGSGTISATNSAPLGGMDVVITMTPSSGYELLRVTDNGLLVDGSLLTEDGGSWKYTIESVTGDHTIIATFAVDASLDHEVTVTAGANGTADPDKPVYKGGESPFVVIRPNAGYTVSEVRDNGLPVQPVQSGAVWIYTIDTITEDHIVTVSFMIDRSITHTITVRAGSNGSASADVPAPKGGDRSNITIVPDPGYRVASLFDNGVEVDIDSLFDSAGSKIYTIYPVTSSHTVNVTFEIDTSKEYNITVNSEGSGTASATPSAVSGGGRAEVKMTPAPGYKISTIIDNGEEVDARKVTHSAGTWTYVLDPVLASHEIDVLFVVDSDAVYNINVSALSNGTAAANDTRPHGGDDVTVTITPKKGYKVTELLDNGISIDPSTLTPSGASLIYKIDNVIAHHIISVTFDVDMSINYTMTVIAGSNGTAAPNDPTPHGGEEVTVTITPNPGYKIRSLTDNGTSIDINTLTPAAGSYLYFITDIFEDHLITVEFIVNSELTHQVLVNAGENGSASADIPAPTGGQRVIVTITPEAGYKIATITDNGTNVFGLLNKAGNSWLYILSSVTYSHNIIVSFNPDDSVTHSVTVNAGSNGSASADDPEPKGGSDVIISITPDRGYRIASMTDNNLNVDITQLVFVNDHWEYTISSIVTGHEINVVFEVDDSIIYDVIVNAGPNGSASADKPSPKGGEVVNITITPEGGYRIASVTDNGTDVDITKLPVNDRTRTYTIASVMCNHEIVVVFAVDTSARHTVTAIPGTNGTAAVENGTPMGGETSTVRITPAPGYRIASMTDNTETVDLDVLVKDGDVWKYIISDITGNHEVTIEFEIDDSATHTVTATAGSNGSISPETGTPAGGTSYVVSITPAQGYKIASVTDNGAPVPLSSLSPSGQSWLYTISQITEDHEVHAEFAADDSESYLIAATSDTNGTAAADIREPNGGDDVKITITPNYGYKIATVTDNTISIDIGTLTKVGGTWVYLISAVVMDHDVHVTFEIDTSKRYAVDVTSGPNGSASADKTTPYGGDDVIVTMTPSTGYRLISLKDNGTDIDIDTLIIEDGSWKYTISSIVGGHEVEAEFGIDTSKIYAIDVTSGPNGSASADKTTPNGGDDVIVTITPDSGFILDAVTDNGNPVDISKLPKVGNVRTYTISTVIGDHAIHATFKVDDQASYDISFDPMVNGDASADIPQPSGGDDVVVTITPEYGYKIETVSDNTTPIDIGTLTKVGNSWKYTITNVTGDHTIAVTFVINDEIRHTIILSEGENGAASADDSAPLGGTEVVITITPDPGYKVATVKDNGKLVTDQITASGSDWKYTTAPVTSDHTIEVTFTVDPEKEYRITISPHPNGTVSANTLVPKGGEDVTVEITPKKGYRIISLKDNDVPVDLDGLTSVGGSSMYVIEFVITDHRIDVVFGVDTEVRYTITTETDGNGTAVSNPSDPVGGGTAAVTITPSGGYRIASIEDNGVQVDLDTLIDDGKVYVIIGILEDHLIRVTFEIDTTQEHDISTETDGKGKAEPNSTVVNGGDDLEILITPNPGFRVKSVTDNGEVVDISKLRPSGQALIYTISEITGDHIVRAEFEIDTSALYSVTIDPVEYGNVTTDKTTARGGENVRITITPEYGYMIASVKDNGSTVDFDTSQPGQPWVYVITAITDNHSIVVVFTINTNMTHYITTNYEGIGMVRTETPAPKGMSDVTVVIAPTPGYKINSVTDNGVSVMDDIQEVTPGVWIYMILSVTSNHTINAVFEIDTSIPHTVTAQTVGDGNVTVNNPSPMGGANSIITITPAAGYRIAKVTDNGVTVNPGSLITLPTGKLYALSRVYVDHVIVVTFEVDPGVGYEVNVVSGENGTAFADKPFPDGGDNVVISITPYAGYRISAVVDNSVTVPPGEIELIDGIWYYTITDVIGDHTVSVLFEIDPTIEYDVDILPAENGTVVKDPLQPHGGDDVIVTLTPAVGYRLYGLKDNGEKVDLNKLIQSGDSWIYTISGIDKDHEIEVKFTIDSSIVYDITINAGANGDVVSDMLSPHGGDTVTITITPDAGYIITSFKDNGIDVEPSKLVKVNGSWTYLIECITSDHVIDAEFGIDTNIRYHITTSTDGNGTATPDPDEVKGGQTSVITMTPRYGYTMGSVTDNGITVDPLLLIYQNGSWKYTLTSVSIDHEIDVVFAVDVTMEHTITVIPGENGTASADQSRVNGGGNVIITITPDTGYGIALLTDNGEKVIPTQAGTKWIYTISSVTDDHTVEVEFDVNSELKYDVIVTSGENGTAVADNTRPKGGDTVTITITPDRGFLISSLTDNGVAVVPVQSGGDWVYRIRSITDNHIIDVKFKADPNIRYDMTVIAGENGEAEADEPRPYGGDDVVIIITPNQGYRVATLIDNGKLIDLSTSLRFGGSQFYTIESVTEDHVIEVTFEINTAAVYDIFVIAGENGTAVADKTSANGGDDVTVTITPSPGYKIASLTDNGVDVTASRSGNSWKYVMFQVIMEHTISVTFEIDTSITYDVTLSMGENGTATADPSVPHGGEDVFICIMPQNGYRIASVTDNGTPVSATQADGCWTYTILSITEDHVISAVFEIDPNQTHTINVSHGDHGTASSDRASVKGGRDATIIMTPDTGYRLLSLTVNGKVIPMSDIQVSGGSLTYVLKKVTETQNVNVLFELITHKITLTQGKGYDILPVDSVSPVLPGESFTFSFALHDEYSRSEYHIFVNNAEVELIDGMYTITNIQSDVVVTVTGVSSNKVELENTTMVVFGSIGAIMLAAIAAGALMSRRK